MAWRLSRWKLWESAMMLVDACCRNRTWSSSSWETWTLGTKWQQAPIAGASSKSAVLTGHYARACSWKRVNGARSPIFTRVRSALQCSGNMALAEVTPFQPPRVFCDWLWFVTTWPIITNFKNTLLWNFVNLFYIIITIIIMVIPIGNETCNLRLPIEFFERGNYGNGPYLSRIFAERPIHLLSMRSSVINNEYQAMWTNYILGLLQLKTLVTFVLMFT